MGKKRDRRQHAPPGSGGRRVKLDLWIEEDSSATKLEDKVNTTSTNVGAGDDKAPVPSGGHPSAKSLSGVLQENPLSLLGQYSDEEVDEQELVMEFGDTNNKESSSQVHHTICDDAQATNYVADSALTGCKKDEGFVFEDVEMLCRAQAENHDEVKDKNEAHNHNDTDVDDTFCSEVENDGRSSHAYLASLSAGGKVEAHEEKEEEVCWEAVLHEESGEYYYWNTRTGKTTWETPSALKPNDQSQLCTDMGSCEIPEEDSSIPSLRNLESSSKHDSFRQSDSEDVYKQSQSVAGLYELECKRSCGDTNSDKPHEEQVGLRFSKLVPELDNVEVEVTVNSERLPIARLAESNMPKCADYASKSGIKPSVFTKPSSRVEGSPERQCSPFAKSENSPSSEPYFTSNELTPENSQLKEKTDHLLEWAESLTSRSKNIIENGLLSIPLHVRLAIEAEVRLTDCRALSSEGCLKEASLMYFEKQFKRIESEIAVEEAALPAKLEQQRLKTAADSEKACLLTADKNEFSGQLYEQPQNVDIPYIAISSCAVTGAAKEETQEDNGTGNAQSGQPQYILESLEPVHLSKPGGDLVEYQIDSKFPSPTTGNELGHVGEVDIDMEVDMEVDDAVESHPQPLSILANHHKSEMYEASQVGLPHKLVQEFSYSFSDSMSSPLPPGTSVSDVWPPPPSPPPDDEWAPPPPEPELVMPPPPEESPHFSTLPVYNIPAPIPGLSLPTLSFYEGMVSGFSSIPHPSYHYETVDVQSSENATLEYFPNSLYVGGSVQAGEPQVNWTDQHQPGGAPLSMPPDLTVIDMNSVSTLVDYTPPLSVPLSTVTIVPLSGTPYMPVDSALSVALDTIPLVEAAREIFSTDSGLPKVESDSILSASSNMESISANSMPSAIVVNPAPGAVVEGSLTCNAKRPAKVTRLKKRTHAVAVSAPLLSNKKVSTLVNKWLAAKEELHGKGDEEEDKALYDLEALEKKRQKEIEEWRREQLASGEALDNANFQPLGTLDWRERVKRAKKVDDVEIGNEVSLDGSRQSKVQLGEGRSRKPDLEELSKELPYGWQAFWDENSGDVYYGNLSTSETTWERPVSN